jgi:hypothetical protein
MGLEGPGPHDWGGAGDLICDAFGGIDFLIMSMGEEWRGFTKERGEFLPVLGTFVTVKGELWPKRGFLGGGGPCIEAGDDVVVGFVYALDIDDDGEDLGIAEATIPGGKCGKGEGFLGCCCILLAVSSILRDCSSNFLTVLFVLCLGGFCFGAAIGVTERFGLLLVIFCRDGWGMGDKWAMDDALGLLWAMDETLGTLDTEDTGGMGGTLDTGGIPAAV